MLRSLSKKKCKTTETRNCYLGECLNDSVKNMPRLLVIVLFHSQLPSGIIVGMRYHKYLQFFVIPFVPFISDLPALLPGTTILVQELDLIVQIFSCNVDDCSRNGVTSRRFAVNRLPWPGESVSSSVEMRGYKGFRNAISEDNEEEKEERK